MLEIIARNWWAIVVRGVVAILFGVAAILWPRLTLGVLVGLFAAYALVDGLFALYTAITRRQSYERWWVMGLEGLAGILFGILTFLYPGITALALLYLIAAWAILTGIVEIAAAIALRKEIPNELLLALSGLLSVVFGLVLIARPGAGALAILWLIGGYAIVFGLVLVALGLRVRRLAGAS